MELIVVVAVTAILMALLFPAVQYARDAARRNQCLSNLRQLGLALHNYHETHSMLPPALVWGGPPGESLGLGAVAVGSIDRVAIGVSPSIEPDRVMANWIIMLLPYLEQGNLAGKYQYSLPVDDPANALVRTTRLSVLQCPTDPYNNKPFERAANAGVMSGHTYARGNYAMNFVPNRSCYNIPHHCPDGPQGFDVADTDLKKVNMQVWGSGIGGCNKMFRMRDFTRGTTRMAAVDEIRAGIDPIDPRGAWALGLAGASFTCDHGIYNLGGTSPPNNASTLADDVCGATKLIAKYGIDNLVAMGMPVGRQFVGRIELNSQATSRSLHPAGVHVLSLDGSAHFISDNISPDVWANYHSRDATEDLDMPFQE